MGFKDDRDDVGAFVITPADLKTEIDTVETGVRQLDAAVAASTAGKDFRDGWVAFVAEWGKFVEAHKNLTDRLWTGDYPVAREFRRRLEDWSLAFAREGWRRSAPPAAGGEPGPAGRDGAAPGPTGYPPGGDFSLGAVLLAAMGGLIVGGLVVYAVED